MLSINKVVHAEDAFCYRDHMCQVSKLQHMYLINYFHKLLYVINIFCTKDHKIHLVISCYTLLHQAARGEGKNSLRKGKDILVSDRDQQRFFIITIT